MNLRYFGFILLLLNSLVVYAGPNPAQMDLEKHKWTRKIRKSSNLLKNPGFEATFGNGSLPQHWYTKSTGMGHPPTPVYSDTFHTGLHSACLATTSDSATVVLQVRDYLPVSPGIQYALMGFVCCKAINGIVFSGVAFLDSSRTGVGGFTGKSFNGTWDWQEYYMDGTAPENACSAMVFCHLKGKGTAWFDNLYFGEYDQVEHLKNPSGSASRSLLIPGLITLFAVCALILTLGRKFYKTSS